jgi:hypothetical protein
VRSCISGIHIVPVLATVILPLLLSLIAGLLQQPNWQVASELCLEMRTSSGSILSFLVYE